MEVGLVDLVADYGHEDCAFTRLVQRLALIAPRIEVVLARVPPCDTVAAGYCVAHLALIPRVVELLKQNDMGDVLVLLGGIIPDDDIPKLKEMGVAGIFGPGANTSDIVKLINEKVKTQS